MFDLQPPRHISTLRNLVIAGPFGEGPFTMRFADLRYGVSRTATFALANCLRATVTKVVRISARFNGTCFGRLSLVMTSRLQS
jgi:hypothetical protein